ncbi:MAG TPA: PfkB family carbohydrate kinase [Opitutaceae bacterium]|nr:PfkB family carbohydrate kinase [Opitutaceae bacterium]
MAHARSTTIACFGEALWDVLPRGIFLGGAPLNVAYHLSRQGIVAVPITAVGRDFLGDEIIRRIKSWGLDSRFIAQLPQFPTGVVTATLDAAGVASYRIARRVAWDHIAIPSALRESTSVTAVVFGTLALRQEFNRRALLRLFAAWPDALRVLDLNLRAPFDTSAAVALALKHAQFVKLNDEELGRMTSSRPRTSAQLERAARRFSAAHGLSQVCVTVGARGAGLLWKDRWHWEDSRPVVVRDTIGAGDAFLAGFLAALLARRASPAKALARAARVGEFVAAHDGATPFYICSRNGEPRQSRR